MQTTIILLVEQIVTALGGEFKVRDVIIIHYSIEQRKITLTTVVELTHSWESQGW